MLETLPVELRRRLDEEPVALIAEYLAGRLGLDGNATLELVYDGWLVRAHVHLGPINRSRLEEFGCRPARPVAASGDRRLALLPGEELARVDV